MSHFHLDTEVSITETENNVSILIQNVSVLCNLGRGEKKSSFMVIYNQNIWLVLYNICIYVINKRLKKVNFGFIMRVTYTVIFLMYILVVSTLILGQSAHKLEIFITLFSPGK
jgi:hypothetical protein